MQRGGDGRGRAAEVARRPFPRAILDFPSSAGARHDPARDAGGQVAGFRGPHRVCGCTARKTAPRRARRSAASRPGRDGQRYPCAEYPKAPLFLSCCATLPDKPRRKRARLRSEATLAAVVESLCRKAAGQPAGLGPNVAVYRHRLRAALGLLDHDDGDEQMLVADAVADASKSNWCACAKPEHGDSDACLKCGRSIKPIRRATRSVLTARHRAQLRAAGWSEKRIQEKDHRLTKEALEAE